MPDVPEGHVPLSFQGEMLLRVLDGFKTEVQNLGLRLDNRLDQTDRHIQQLGERLGRMEGVEEGRVREMDNMRSDVDQLRSDFESHKTATLDADNDLGNRITRLETLIVPGASIAAAVISAVVAHLIH
jgi:hypothetical protein